VATVEHALLGGLQELSTALLGRSWGRQSNTAQPLAIEQLMIDANWQASTDLVYQVARTIGGGKLTPSHGRFIGSSSVPMEAWPVKDGDKPGHGWRVSLGRRRQRHVILDVNMWKTVVAQRLRGPTEPNGIALFGEFPQEHQMLGDQLAAEYSILNEARGRKVNEWKLRPGRDNHWWDCIVGSAVAASIAGASIPGQVQLRRTKRISYAEAQAAKRNQR
jgi:phage terminase large subunit GpA-like protein